MAADKIPELRVETERQEKGAQRDAEPQHD